MHAAHANKQSCLLRAQCHARQVMGMGDISKVDAWREPDGVRVDKLIMRPSQDQCAQGLRK